MAKIHEPLPPRKDATGLELVGRNRDGRYQYRSLSVLHQENIVNLTHEGRVGLAVVRALLVAEWGRYDVYPMTRESASAGWGSYGIKRQWIQRPELRDIGRAFLKGMEAKEAWRMGLFNTVAHECGHNFQHGTGHGPDFKASEVRCRVRLQARLSKGWPKVDRRTLRDTPTPSQRKRAARQAKKDRTPAQRWREALTHAERMEAKYLDEASRAAKLAARWSKKRKHAASWLKRLS